MGFVQSQENQADSASSITVTLDSTPTAGNMLIAIISTQGSSSTGHTWDTHTGEVNAGSEFSTAGGGGACVVLYLEDIQSAEVTAAHTFTLAATADVRAYLVEIDEVPTSPTVQYTGNDPSGSGTTMATNDNDNVDPTNDGSIMVMGGMQWDMDATNTQTHSVDSGFTEARDDTNDTNVALGSILIYKDNVDTEADCDGTISFTGSGGRRLNAGIVVQQEAGGTTVTPAVFSADYSFPAATPTGAALVTPAVFSADYTFPAATPQGQAQTTPAVFEADYTFPAVAAVEGQALVTPAVFSADYTFGAPTPLGQALVTPGVFTADYTFPAVSVKIGKTVLPAVFSADFTFPAPTVLAASLVTPAVFEADYTFPAPTPQGQALVTPAVFSGDYSFPAATPLGQALTTPSVFAADYTFYSVGLLIGLPATPAVFTADYTFYTPTVVIGGDTVVEPAVFTADYSFPAATPLGQALVTPSVFSGDYTFPAVAAVEGQALVTPAVFSADYSFPAVTVIGLAVVTPAVFTADYTFPAVADFGVLTVVIYAPEACVMYRLPGAAPRLVAGIGPRRSMTVGLNAGEGWERVSEQFKMNGDTAGIDAVQTTLAAAWAANSGAAEATLKAAIDTALQAAGYRRLDGSDIT